MVRKQFSKFLFSNMLSTSFCRIYCMTPCCAHPQSILYKDDVNITKLNNYAALLCSSKNSCILSFFRLPLFASCSVLAMQQPWSLIDYNVAITFMINNNNNSNSSKMCSTNNFIAGVFCPRLHLKGVLQSKKLISQNYTRRVVYLYTSYFG